MHVHLPKPLHGWRAFAGEVGIIVIGVLIALGAEQLAEAVHWSHEVAGARKALNAELDHDLGAVEFVRAQRTCLLRRLDDLAEYDRSWRSGKPLRLTAPNGMITTYTIHSNVWDIVKSGQTAAHMSLEQQLDHAHIYDVLENVQNQTRAMTDRWHELQELTRAQALDDARLSRMEMDMDLLRRFPTIIDSNLDEIAPSVQRLGLRPDTLREYRTADARQLCMSILPPKR